jgi:2-keto-4-pentenoate hydratase/2-oxohepta-3-ene-1,7-dioic acid hydratase in catechol pathway
VKLVSFLHGRAATPRIGALRDQTIVDLTRVDPGLPADMLALLASGSIARAERALAAAGPEHAIRLADARLGPPIARPGKIMCIGLNYRDHARETNQAVPDFPTLFAKYSSCVIGPGEPIVLPRLTKEIDYEAELGVVIGKRAKHVAEAEALEYVAGYVPFNDVSARDYQRRTSQWTIGKTFDTFGPMGPALVTADEVPDPHGLDIQLSIDGEVLQHSNTRELVFSVQQLISILSGVVTLEPGDLISTGTPSGVGAARTPKRWLRPGETVRIEIEKLGALSNPVVDESA